MTIYDDDDDESADDDSRRVIAFELEQVGWSRGKFVRSFFVKKMKDRSWRGNDRRHVISCFMFALLSYFDCANMPVKRERSGGGLPPALFLSSRSSPLTTPSGYGCPVTVLPSCLASFQKYTTFVQTTSATFPRIDLAPLARVLNAIERGERGAGRSGVGRDEAGGATGDAMTAVEQSGRCAGDGGADAVSERVWRVDRVNDSGPLLRLESVDRHLTKAERYGHPFERPLLKSTHLTAARARQIVLSFFRFGYRDVERQAVWSWASIHSFNASIAPSWAEWERSQLG
jgi:hypothetical protein